MSHVFRASGNPSIASRVSHAQYEVSDRLSFFLCQRRPDHNQGQHFLVPDSATNNKMATIDEARVAKRRLQMLSNNVFEELAMDVYDEVDRRETDAIWATLNSKGSTSPAASVCLPFLPVNPDYGTSRNQARQKLARLDKTEFSTLVTDVLKEIRRRTLETSGGGGNIKGSPLRENPPPYRGPQHKSLPASIANRFVKQFYLFGLNFMIFLFQAYVFQWF